MITMLRFRPDPSGVIGDKLVREACFEPITDVPLSAVCMAANHARAQLSQLLARELTLDVFAPVLVKDGTQRVIFDSGLLFGTRGTTCDAYVIFRRPDARRIAHRVFGEDEGGAEDSPLSSLEERALERIAHEVIAFCAPFCGTVGPIARLDPERDAARCVTYFELRIGAPFDAVIGVGLSKDPSPSFGGTIDRAVLCDVVLDVRAQFGEAMHSARDVAGWTVGTTVRLDTKIGAPTTLKVGDIAIAGGDCGIRAESHAVAIRTTPSQGVAP